MYKFDRDHTYFTVLTFARKISVNLKFHTQLSYGKFIIDDQSNKILWWLKHVYDISMRQYRSLYIYMDIWIIAVIFRKYFYSVYIKVVQIIRTLILFQNLITGNNGLSSKQMKYYYPYFTAVHCIFISKSFRNLWTYL